MGGASWPFVKLFKPKASSTWFTPRSTDDWQFYEKLSFVLLIFREIWGVEADARLAGTVKRDALKQNKIKFPLRFCLAGWVLHWVLHLVLHCVLWFLQWLCVGSIILGSALHSISGVRALQLSSSINWALVSGISWVGWLDKSASTFQND